MAPVQFLHDRTQAGALGVASKNLPNDFGLALVDAVLDPNPALTFEHRHIVVAVASAANIQPLAGLGQQVLVRPLTAVTDILFGAIELRPYLPLGADDQAELGLAFRFGYFAMIYPDAPEADLGRSDRVWSGVAASLGPDLHYWFSPSLGLIVAADLSAGGGADHSDEAGYYIPERAGFAAVTGWLGIIVAL